MLNDVNQYIDRDEMSLPDWELFLAAGWDRVGKHFFHRRYDHFKIMDDWAAYLQLMPLRYNLDKNFQFSKSQRINQDRNADLKRIFRPAQLDDEKIRLFDEWYIARFGRVGNISTWVTADEKPFPTYEVSIFKKDRLVACSYFDVTPQFQYSTVAIYDPNESKRSLGTYTLLSEIEFGLVNKKKFHYPGHAYYENSMYDYKKKFHNMEYFDWESGGWAKLERTFKL